MFRQSGSGKLKLACCSVDGTGMKFEYKTEGVYLEEKFLGRTSAASDMSSIASQLNEAAAQGWELVQIAKIDVVGKVFKSSERRDVAVAVYRRPLG
jgi:hypothetical protein